MKSGDVLCLIWQDGVTVPDRAARARFETAFHALLPVRHVALKAGGACSNPLALADSLELAPALPLGDVLVEELPLDLPYDTLVLLLPQDAECEAEQLGGAVVEALHLMIRTGGLPMERETDALFVSAHVAARRARHMGARDAGFDAARFCIGMARSLGRIWGGAKATDPTMFTRPDFLVQVPFLMHLRALDPFFTAPDPSQIPDALLDVAAEPISLSAWVARMESVLRAIFGAPVRGPARVPSSFPKAFNPD
ncbi:hypothetical protein [Sagittula salina]|uniref:Uncharacterized protein n=1 Tax=Sagittula salina TaxID=2820268 RepID=A0A940MV80_9RHOB|nr:hypothetical protein [Sagittula salina]MBP0484572.1 hypothetical protein [Sagittula salina]